MTQETCRARDTGKLAAHVTQRNLPRAWPRKTCRARDTGKLAAHVTQGNLLRRWHRETYHSRDTGKLPAHVTQGNLPLTWHRETCRARDTGKLAAHVTQGNLLRTWHWETCRARDTGWRSLSSSSAGLLLLLSFYLFCSICKCLNASLKYEQNLLDGLEALGLPWGKVNFCGKGGHTNIQPSMRPWIEPGTFGSDLGTAPTSYITILTYSHISFSFFFSEWWTGAGHFYVWAILRALLESLSKTGNWPAPCGMVSMKYPVIMCLSGRPLKYLVGKGEREKKKRWTCVQSKIESDFGAKLEGLCTRHREVRPGGYSHI